MKKWLKSKLRKWLNIEQDIADIYDNTTILAKEFGNTKCKLHNLTVSVERSKTTLNNKIEAVGKMVKVAIDVTPHNRPNSWAIVCVKGREDLIQFYELHSEDAKQVKRFADQFIHAHRSIDAPRTMKKFFE